MYHLYLDESYIVERGESIGREPDPKRVGPPERDPNIKPGSRKGKTFRERQFDMLPENQPWAKKPANESYELYDLVLAHLIDEGYADTYESANAIMANMSEDWVDSIVEDIRGAITYNPDTRIGRLKRRIKGSTPQTREARTRAYQGNRSDAPERYGASQRNPYDDNRGDIPSLRGR